MSEFWQSIWEKTLNSANDLLLRPELAKGDQIIAIPTLVRKLPVPVKKIIGSLKDTERVLVGLDLKEKQSI